MKKVFPILVGVSLLAVVSCNAQAVSLEEKAAQLQDAESKLPTAEYYQGTHRFNSSTIPNKYLLKDGVSEYKLVYRDEAGLVEKTAVTEFNYFFKKATGIELETITDKGLVHDSSQHYISLGDTTLLQTSGLTYDFKSLTDDGVMIQNKNNNIYLIGGSESGVIYSVYDLFKILFNYEQYGVDTYELDTGITTIRMRNFDVLDIPDIPLRCNNYGFFTVGTGTYNQSVYGYRMRMYKDRGYYMMPVFKEYDTTSSQKTSTNTNTYVPYEKFHATKPNWFSNKCSETTNEYQLCYTAHGDEDDYNELVDEVAHKIEFSLSHFTPDLYPEMSIITFTMEDNFNTCSCDACIEAKNKYGCDAGALNVFVNKVGEKVENWMKEKENAQYARDDFHIIFFAYNAFEQAPAHYDTSLKKYVANYPEVRLRSNVGAYFAEINNMDYQQDFFCEKNENGKQMFDAWCDISDFVYYWTYETNFKLYMYMYDSFSCFNQHMYNYMASKRINMFFAQGQESSGKNGTTWNTLKGYLDAKLGWDSTLDQTVLTDNFFKAMYKDAANEMKELFYLTRAQNMEVFEKNPNFLGLRSNYNEVNKSRYYPLNNLKSLVKKVDNALLKIEKYKIINPDLYLELYRNIEAEAVTPLYIMLDLQISNLTIDEKANIISRLYDDISLLSLESKKTREHGIALSEELIKFEAK